MPKALEKSAGIIINSEFGEKVHGTVKVHTAIWWDDLLERVNQLCEEGKMRGYKNCEDIHKEKIFTPHVSKCRLKNLCKFFEEEV